LASLDKFPPGECPYSLALFSYDNTGICLCFSIGGI
jgi:hypothetical protein